MTDQIVQETVEQKLQNWLVAHARLIRPADNTCLMAWALAALQHQGRLLLDAPSPAQSDEVKNLGWLDNTLDARIALTSEGFRVGKQAEKDGIDIDLIDRRHYEALKLTHAEMSGHARRGDDVIAILDSGLRAIAVGRHTPAEARLLAKQHLNQAGAVATAPVTNGAQS